MLWIRDCCIGTIYCEGLNVPLPWNFSPEINCCPIFCGLFGHTPACDQFTLALKATGQPSPVRLLLLAAQVGHLPCQTQMISSLIVIWVLSVDQAEVAS